MLRTAEETAEQLHHNHQALRGQENYTEADTIDFLILPLLDFWGYPTLHRRREHQHKGNRIDITLYDSPAPRPPRSQARAIIEAKPLGADLSGRNKARANRPKEQLHRYLEDTPESQPGTYGILTDGNVWHILRRNAAGVNELIHEYRLLTDDIKSCIAALQEIRDLLSSQQTLHVFQPKTPTSKYQKAQALCNAVAEGKNPAEILRLITDQRISQDLTGAAALTGKARHAHNTHWDQYAFAPAGRIKVDQGDTDHEALCAAVLQANPAKDENDEILRREDVAVAATAFAITAATKMSLVLMIQPDQHGEPVSARLAVHHQGHTGMTAEFNPALPSPQILKTLQGTLDALNAKQTITPGKLADLVAAKGIRQEFYKKVARWTLHQYENTEGSPEKQRIHRETVLRHLIRSIFTWILKEDGKLPLELFDEAFKRDHAEGQYHSQILTWLFHERLNKPPNDRIKHEIPALQTTMQEVRFLNGSLFARHKHDADLQLSDADYFSIDSDNPGLFSIFSEYDWTANEHSVHSSDQAIDPEVLSSMFENLIAVTDHGAGTPKSMPAGTYYTPADVATEMVKDALVAAVEKQTPTKWTEKDLLAFFSGNYENLPDLTKEEEKLLRSRLQELTIFDPACGSGQFPFLMALTLRDAITQLSENPSTEPSPEQKESLTRDIIARQLFAQDINPMAVQIARLRLFIALIAAEDPDTEPQKRPPLPNLEAKILCADTLATVASPRWDPFHQLAAQNKNFEKALQELVKIREQWQHAHDEPTKTDLRKEDEKIRQELKPLLTASMASKETEAFADHPLLDPESPPAQTDPRLLFYPQTGFDIVIGNPPYESVNKNLQPAKGTDKAEQKRLEIRRKERKESLQLVKNYRTTAGGDLYNLIAEAALILAKPEGGVVELVVPLSLCFGQDQKDTRRLFEERCSYINLRCQDNRPDKTFHESPVEHQESRQRTTILTAKTGQQQDVQIKLSDTHRWRRTNRHEYLNSRPKQVLRKPEQSIDPRLDSQWERILTQEIQAMISAMRVEPTKIQDLQNIKEEQYVLGLPPTAMYFITTTPAGLLDRRENLLPMASQESMELATAVANTHAGYAWWKAFGDAFDLNPYEIGTIPVPISWIEVESLNRQIRHLAQQLIKAVNPDNVKKITTGIHSKVQESLNFHECVPGIIADLDHLYLDALGLPQQPLMKQLHALRTNSAWRI